MIAAESTASPDPARERFERCFREHYADVLAFALRRLADRGAAEEVAADTFAVAWRRRAQLPVEARPWLFGIARRVLANQRRSTRRRWNLEQRLASETGAAIPAKDDPGEALERRSSFAAAFRQLGEGEREVLSLIAWEGLAPRQAASVLGCSHAAFRVRFHRARRKLEKQIAAAGHSPGSGQAAAPIPSEETR
jgi:RNA polymerase sigma-70 factor (ECF subfamily)